MLTDSEGSEEALHSGETQDKVSNSPSGDTSVPSTNTDISEVPTIIETSQLSKNVNSPETLPPRQTSESEELSEALPKYENTKPHTEKDLETFSTSDISVYKSDTTTLFKAAGAKESPDSSCKRKRQTSDVKEPEVTGVINEAFELLQSTDDVQIDVTSSKTYAVRSQQVKNGWNVFENMSLVGLLVALIVWAAIFFPLLLNGMI